MNATQLKVIGIVSMTIDHIGYFLFPQMTVLRMIGRLAYPIFAYMIAEGCRYTRNKVRYFCTMFAIACTCSAAAYFAERSLYQSIFTTFSCAMLLIFALDAAEKAAERARNILWGARAVMLTFLYFAVFQLRMIPGLETDYGFLGIIAPVLAWLGRSKAEKLSGLTVGLCLLSAELGTVQFCSLAAVALLYFYNGKRGNHSLKWAFYGYYPLHIAALYGIAQIAPWGN